MVAVGDFSSARLGEFEYVLNSLKTDSDIQLVLCERARVDTPLKRTADDDQQPVLVPKHRDIEDPASKVTRSVEDPASKVTRSVDDPTVKGTKSVTLSPG